MHFHLHLNESIPDFLVFAFFVYKLIQLSLYNIACSVFMCFTRCLPSLHHAFYSVLCFQRNWYHLLGNRFALNSYRLKRLSLSRLGLDCISLWGNFHLLRAKFRLMINILRLMKGSFQLKNRRVLSLCIGVNVVSALFHLELAVTFS